MHSAFKEASCSSASEMLEERESEVNVMDFVETEYKSDEQEDVTKHKKSRRRTQKQQKMLFYIDDQFDLSPLPSPRPTKKYSKKRRKKSISKSKSAEDNHKGKMECYPYAMLLRSLCNEVGIFHPLEPPSREKVFKQLSPSNIHYPFASLLQELHQAIMNHNYVISTVSDSSDQLQTDISQIMKSLKYNLSEAEEEEVGIEMDNNENFDAPFSDSLLGIILKEKIEMNSNDGGRCMQGIGQILNSCMSVSSSDEPFREMQSSALLLKLSLQAEKEMLHTNNKDPFADAEAVELSAESSQEEEVEWKPATRGAEGSSEAVGVSALKRRSVRMKKCIEKYDASPSVIESKRSKTKLSSNSSSESRLLLQLILGKGVSTPEKEETITRKCKDSQSRSKVLKKIRSRIKKRMKSVDEKKHTCNNPITTGIDLSSLNEKHRFQTEIHTVGQTEEQSLLKEYLLKPAGEESILKTSLDTDIPKISTNSFLFSRLLQNFNALSENNHPGSSLCATEESSGSKILREMLLQSCSKTNVNYNKDNEDDQDKPYRPLEHLYLSALQKCADDFAECEEPLSENMPEKVTENTEMPSTNILREILIGSQCNPELYFSNNCDESQDGKNLTLNEHLNLPLLEKNALEKESSDLRRLPLCKIKCEDEFVEDAFECHICHLEFSSSLDLSNHKMLFHCDEEIRSQVDASSPTCILPHGSDNVQKSLFVEKLPA